MPVATLATILANIKVATDIAKALKSSDLSYEKAELKLKLAEMISALADAKSEVTEIQQVIAAKDHEIAELQDAFQSKDAVVKRYDAYYHTDTNGQPVGEPFCMSCWQVKHKKYSLQQKAGDRHTRVCVACGSEFSDRLASAIGTGQQDA